MEGAVDSEEWAVCRSDSIGLKGCLEQEPNNGTWSGIYGSSSSFPIQQLIDFIGFSAS